MAALSESLHADTVAQRHVDTARSMVAPSLNLDMIQKFYSYGQTMHENENR